MTLRPVHLLLRSLGPESEQSLDGHYHHGCGVADCWSVGLARLAVVLPRTPVGNIGRLLAIVVPSLLALLIGLDGVAIVSDAGKVVSGVPEPEIPLFSLAFNVLTGALSIAAVILVQGAGVSQSVPNPDGSRSSASRDFIAQGAANIVSGFFRGLPIVGLSTHRAYVDAKAWLVSEVESRIEFSPAYPAMRAAQGKPRVAPRRRGAQLLKRIDLDRIWMNRSPSGRLATMVNCAQYGAIRQVNSSLGKS